MLSTLSINANGEVVGGSTKFKLSSNHLFADAGPNDQQQQQDQKKATESAKDSLSTAQIDMLKGDLQDLEASIDNDNRSLLDHRGGNTTPCDGQVREGAPTTCGAAAQPSQPIPIIRGSSASGSSSSSAAKKMKHQLRKKVLKGVLAQAADKADDGVNPKWRVRLMTEADVDEVLRIQRLCYEPEYRELPESYTGRIRLYPQGNVIVEVPVSAATGDNDDSRECDYAGDSSDDSSDSDSDSENDNDNDVSNDCDHDDTDNDDDSDNDQAVPMVKNQVTRYSPSGSPRCEEDVHSVKKRRLVGKPAATTTQWRMAGYIQAQPYLREGINDVNDLTDLERWLADHPTMELDAQRDVIYVHEIAMDPAFRGQGLTTPLTDYVQQLTADEGFQMITLVSLGPALGFWKRNGFVLCRDLDYGGHTCYYMEKPLVAQPLADR